MVDNNGVRYHYTHQFKEIYDSNNLITITDDVSESNIIRDLFFSVLNTGGVIMNDGVYKRKLKVLLKLNEDEWVKIFYRPSYTHERNGLKNARLSYQNMVNSRNELEDLKRKNKNK